MEQLAPRCPTENELLAWVSSSLPPEQVHALDVHLDTCSTCRTLVAEAARAREPSDVLVRRNSTFQVGETVSGRYVIVGWLGAGGMGEVYEAEDTWLGEMVALKTVAPTIADDQAALARLRAEVRLARRVTHENVCRVYDLGYHAMGRERLALVSMELLRGITLRQHVKEAGALTTHSSLPLIKQIVLALANAHQAGVVHRDLKTDNVMLVAGDSETQRRAVVMDFGLARSALAGDHEALTPNSHRILGTLDYMSPEQVQGVPATRASDIFALGVVMYEMLTGKLPFAGESPLARALMRVTTNAPRLRDAIPTVPVEWDRCVARCLALQPSDRFADVRRVIECLEAGEPSATRRAGAISTVVRCVPLLAAGLLGAGAFCAVERISLRKEPPHETPIAVRALPSPSSLSSVERFVAGSIASSAAAMVPSASESLQKRPAGRGSPSQSALRARTMQQAPVNAVSESERDYGALIDPQNPYATAPVVSK